jgi:hypothetical protein
VRAICGNGKVSKQFGFIHVLEGHEPLFSILAPHCTPCHLLFPLYTLNTQTHCLSPPDYRVYLSLMPLPLLLYLSNSEQYSVSDGYHLSPSASSPSVLSSTARSAPRELELLQRVPNFSRADTSPYRAEKQSLGGDLCLIRTHDT